MAIVQFMRKSYDLLVGEPTAEQIKIQKSDPLRRSAKSAKWKLKGRT